jgi:hypothetical protein
MALELGDRVSTKAILLGNAKVGKTTIIRKRPQFSAEPRSTMGAGYRFFTIDSGDEPTRILLWDTAGEEVFRALVPSYAHGAEIAFVVFSVNDTESFTDLPYWLNFVCCHAASPCLTILVANALGRERMIRRRTAQAFAMNHNLLYQEVIDPDTLLYPEATGHTQTPDPSDLCTKLVKWAYAHKAARPRGKPWNPGIQYWAPSAPLNWHPC